MKPYSFLFILGMALMVSCGNYNRQTAPDDGQTTAGQASPDRQNSFALDAGTAADGGVSVGQPAPQRFATVVKANGMLKVQPQSEASVASPIGANVRRILVTEGQRVARGQTLALVSHPDLLDLQGRYLAASSRMGYVAQEYQRQKQLYDSKVGSGRDFQQITSEYRQLQGELRVTARQLALMGISPAAVKAGRTVDAIAIKSPIAGTVETVSTTVGQYAGPESSLFTIVNTDKVYADVLVYENDMKKVSAGNAAELASASLAEPLGGKVTSVGNVFDDSSRAVHVRIALTGSRGRLVPGAYVTASIRSASTSRLAVPDGAVASDDDRKYVFLVRQEGRRMVFTPREVRLGQHNGAYQEVVAGLKATDRIALSGAYTLMSEWKKADAEQ